MSTGRRLVVLQSFPAPRPTTNPYIVMLARSLQDQPDVDLRYFSWREALLGRYDVVHLHWPEILTDGHSARGRAARQALFAALLLRWRWRSTPVVRTVHNLDRPRGLSRRQSFLLDRLAALTTVQIRLNALTEVRGPSRLIPLGHYRDWYAAGPPTTATAGRLAFVGLVRRYKGVERLIEAFRATTDPALTLHVSGRPSNPDLAAAVTALAAPDPRITLRLAFLPDPELVAEVGLAELVVLPFREMHNSSTVLTALSLDRPVLVPDNAANRALALEVGPGWVLTYAGELTGADLTGALARLRSTTRTRRPDLDVRHWADAGRDHVSAYRAAVAASR